jgi:UDP-glucose:glycoprotein glucosyltransferase
VFSRCFLQKEPKLARARKIPEWEAYDAEIARFARKLAEDGVIRSGMAAADANVLANEGAVPQSSSTSTTDEPSSVLAENHSDQTRDEL